MASKTFATGSSGTRAARRAVRHFARRAARALAAARLSDAAVHTARKDLKRSRAALRLLRPALGEASYRRENALLRNAAHALNAARDAKVLRQTLGGLRRGHRALRGDAAVTALLRTLQAERLREQRRLREHPQRLQRSRRALERLCARVSGWRFGARGWSVLGPALQRIYRHGRRAQLLGRSRPTDETLHEWRKQAKYLRYALEILAPLQPRRLARLARQAGRLTDCLGEAHDLALLAARVRPYLKSNRAGLAALFAIIERRRKRLTLEALARGQGLYGARPRDWEKSLQRGR